MVRQFVFEVDNALRVILSFFLRSAGKSDRRADTASAVQEQTGWPHLSRSGTFRSHIAELLAGRGGTWEREEQWGKLDQ